MAEVNHAGLFEYAYSFDVLVLATPSLLLLMYLYKQGFLSYLHILPTRKRPLPILQDVSGIIKPGR